MNDTEEYILDTEFIFNSGTKSIEILLVISSIYLTIL